MTADTAVPRDFRVRARHEDRHQGRIVSEPTFEAAAMAYIEHLHPLVGRPVALGVIVHELATGHEHSFLIDLDPDP